MRLLYEKRLLPGQDRDSHDVVNAKSDLSSKLASPILSTKSEAVEKTHNSDSGVVINAPQSVMDRIRELTDAGESAAAVALLEEALKKDPNNVVLLTELGVISVLDFKDLERGQKLFERVVNLDPLNRGALNELLILYEDLGRISDGLEFLSAHLTVDADVSEVQYAYAKLLVRAGKQLEALDSFEAATTSIRDLQDQVYLDLAEAAMSVSKPDRAISAIETALRLQEQELQRAKDRQAESVDFIEDRIIASKVAYARALLSVGRSTDAGAILDTIAGRDEDPVVASARREVQSAAKAM